MLHGDRNCHRALAGCCENVWFERDWMEGGDAALAGGCKISGHVNGVSLLDASGAFLLQFCKTSG